MRRRWQFLTVYVRTDVFGTHLQDLSDAVMVPVIVTGYRHYVPAVVQATIEELYRTGMPNSPTLWHG